MKILFILNSILDFKSGCHFYRVFLPSLFFMKNGHEVRFITHHYDNIEKRDELFKWADIVSFSRAYKNEKELNECISLCKKYNKKIAYDLDDDIWNIIDENPAIASKNKMKESGEKLLDVADIVTTTTDELADVLKKRNKNVKVIPNSIDKSAFVANKKTDEKLPIVTYSGSASHWKDMLTILPTLEKIKKEIPFVFILVGFTQSPLDSAMYEYDKLEKYGATGENGKYQKVALECYEYLKRMHVIHFPFYTPELYPSVFSNMVNADIGLCPLEDNEFNKSKSCVKFYEYGSCGLATLAPRLLPYSKEVDYTYVDLNDFEAKLRRLLTNKDFRNEVAERQRKWVLENREMDEVIKLWIKTYE